MLQKIIHFSIHNKLLVGLMTLALVVWGIYNLTRLPIDAVPDITNNQVQVITVSPALGAQEVERLISFPVELSVASVPGIIEIRSFSRFGLSLVTIVFEEDTDVYWARQQITERLQQAQIPAGLGTPTLAPVTTGLGEIYQYALHPLPGYESRYSAAELRTIQDWIVRRQLLGTPGVAEVSSFGGKLKQYEVALQPDKLRALGVTITEVFDALAANNANAGGAYIEKEPHAYFIRTEGLVKNAGDIGKIVVKSTAAGVPVLIGDLAQVREGSAIRYGAMVKDHEGEVAGGIVMMLKGENSSRVIRQVKDKIQQIQKSLPEGVRIEPFLDRTKLVNRAISTVQTNLAEGALIVVFVLVLLLGNLRAGLLVASVIPLAMLFAISLMNVFGVSGNLMSLGALDFGLIVDGAVIIVESVIHRIQLGQHHPGVARLSRQQMDGQVCESASRMMGLASFGQIIILIVYLPILALVGIEGKMFRPMAQTVAFAIGGAFLLSLTYVPMMAALVLSRRTTHQPNVSDRIMAAIARAYLPLLAWALRKKKGVLLAAAALLAVALLLFTRMGGEFIPSLDEGDFAIETRVLTGSSLNETIAVVKKASAILKANFPEVDQVVTKIGSAEVPTEPNPVELGDMIVVLKDQSQWTSAASREELANQISRTLSEHLPQASFGVQQPIQMRFNELMTGARQDVVVKIYGEDLDTLAVYADKLARLIQPVAGAQDLYIEKMTGLPQVMVEYNRDDLARYGLSIAQVNRTVTAAFAGERAGQVYEGERRFDLVVRLDQQHRRHLQDVQNLYVSNAAGFQVPLRQLAQVSMKQGPNQIQRDDTKRRISVGFNVRNRDVQSIVGEIRGRVDRRLPLPPGYAITYGGQFQNLVEAKDRLSVAVPLALGLIFLLLFFAFKSVKQSILIFTAIPLSAIGGVFALLLRDMPFSISAGVGFIALFGVAVLNGIVMIGYFNQLKAGGLTDVEQIIRRGAAARLRPIVMTATVASLGFLPMALSNSAGAEVQKPLATVVIGGLVSATLLTLLVLPILYYYSETGLKKKKKNLRLQQAFLVLLLLGGATAARAQQPQPLSLEQVLTLARENNQALKKAGLEVELRTTLKRTALDLPKTDIHYARGQQNSPQTDDRLSISQTIPLPSTWKTQGRLLQEQVVLSQQQLRLQQHELDFQVKQVYSRLAYLYELNTLLQRQDSIFSMLEKAAAVKFRSGESGILEKTTATTQRLELSDRIRQHQADIHIAQARLNALVQAPQPGQVRPDRLPRAAAALPADTAGSHPLLAVAQQQIVVAERERQAEKSKLSPDLRLGYFNQSLTGAYEVGGQVQRYGRGDRFQGLEAGIALPLWFGAQASRIRAAGLNKQMAAAELQNQQQLLQQELVAAAESSRRLASSLAFYRDQVLVNAGLALQQADKAYRSGEAGYLHYLQAADQLLRIRQHYLQLLLDYQLNQHQIAYLNGS